MASRTRRTSSANTINVEGNAIEEPVGIETAHWHCCAGERVDDLLAGCGLARAGALFQRHPARIDDHFAESGPRGCLAAGNRAGRLASGRRLIAAIQQHAGQDTASPVRQDGPFRHADLDKDTAARAIGKAQYSLAIKAHICRIDLSIVVDVEPGGSKQKVEIARNVAKGGLDFGDGVAGIGDLEGKQRRFTRRANIGLVDIDVETRPLGTSVDTVLVDTVSTWPIRALI